MKKDLSVAESIAVLGISCTVFVGAIIAAVGLVLYHALFLSLAWNLFMPQFLGVPKLSIPVAVALTSTLSMLRGTTSTSKTDPNSKIPWALPLFIPPFLFLMVWIASRFM